MDDRRKKKLADYFSLLWGLSMHFFVLWGVLDANFHSPILQGLPATEAPQGPPAKRLLLFVADGLRFRTFIDDPPPFLRETMRLRGSWGVSHTRMPTESRPGNVAIAAGLYEDPSALFKGWKENPVDFDSVFNRSTTTWAWGSPDVIPMFAKSSDRIHGESYPAQWQDFDASAESTVRLDTWVFDRFFKWLKEEAPGIADPSGLLLFFHLLGCDTAGHASKPYSREYKENMMYVDREIGKVVKLTEKYFNDNATAYVFTADHGMTDWGSHGSGSTDETETPLVVWGAGINRLDKRQDIEQADIAPLISSILGTSIPVNNEGVLPRGYLKEGNDMYGAYALRSNIAQLSVQVRANRIVCCGNDPDDAHWRERELDEKIRRIDEHLANGRVSQAIEEGEEAILLSKESLSYYRGYQRNRFIFYLSVAWLGWIVFLFHKLNGPEPKRNWTRAEENPSSRLVRLANAVFFILMTIVLLEDQLSGRPGWRVSIYGIVALLSVWLAARNAIEFSAIRVKKNDALLTRPVVGTLLLVGSMSAGLIFRSFFAIGMIIIGGMQKILWKDAKPELWWTALALAIFPLLPVVGPNPRTYIVLASLALAAIGLTVFGSSRKSLKIIEMTRLAATLAIVGGLVDGRNCLSWLILLTTPLSICLYTPNSAQRIVGVVYGLLCPYTLLSASYEPLFYLILAAHLLSWPTPEATNLATKKTDDMLASRDTVRAVFFMMYTLLCFFGTGNIASISSFDPTWTRHFVTVFSPFIMTGLIVLKLGIPLILVGCSSRVFSASPIFLRVLLLGDCLSMPLMYGITTEGSWLDIGTAISRYSIAMTLPCLLLVLYYLSRPLVTFRLTLTSKSSDIEKKQRV